MFKLFKPTAPQQHDFSTEAGQRINFAFPKTESQLVAENTHGHTVTLAAAVSRIQMELRQLRTVIEGAQGLRAVGVVMQDISITKDLVEAHRLAREKAQAQARAGLIAEKDILPALQLEDQTRDTYRALHTELAAVTQANEAGNALDKLLADIQ
ncbi:hypothetical protein AX768_07025 [Burkholderia sp. PAMC 28687]|uniref:hypothetical protein n=1 Tax=Burkholderia sp. PAMC 28687 TaxID=1795874 RepID=UPI000785A780|nr:hypothetical protein [Burkholderia sp. PAMC 28687]AMM13890.1 hypothetical protein AX768_07025 [Burkholderia sp. PAMC 28687]